MSKSRVAKRSEIPGSQKKRTDGRKSGLRKNVRKSTQEEIKAAWVNRKKTSYRDCKQKVEGTPQYYEVLALDKKLAHERFECNSPFNKSPAIPI